MNKISNSRKAQFKSMETIIIVIILTMLFIIGFVIYHRISEANFEQKQEQIEKARMAKVNSMIANLPELKCSTLRATEVACVDEYKIMAFSNLYINQDYFYVYDSIFGDVKIDLFVEDLTNRINYTYTIYNASFDEAKSITPVYNPVAVYDSINKTTKFGMLITTFYEE